MTQAGLILGVESSCDETAAAVVAEGRRILSSVVASQIDMHAEHGGVVPELASRAHVEKIAVVIEKALDEAQLRLADVEAIAVTSSPGLIGALLVGVEAAKGLALGAGKSLVAVHHVRAHLYSPFLEGPRAETLRVCLAPLGDGSDAPPDDAPAVAAAGAHQPVHVSVNVDDLFAARRVVQTIHVLRERPHAIESLLELCDHMVRPVGARTAARVFDLVDVLPGDRGVSLKHRSRKGRLDGDAIVGFVLLVESADAAVGRQPRIGRDASTGDEEHAAAVA